jgi:hypothetical protein
MFTSIRPFAALSYQDSGFMQSYCRKNFRFHSAPDWVFDDEQVRRVVSAEVAILARVTTIPEDLRMLRLLNRRAIKLLRKSSCYEWHQLARAAQRKGLPAYYASVIYKTYRCGFDSVQCATDLHVSPVVVRVTINRLKRVATRLEGSRIRWRFRAPNKKKKAEQPLPGPVSKPECLVEA